MTLTDLSLAHLDTASVDGVRVPAGPARTPVTGEQRACVPPAPTRCEQLDVEVGLLRDLAIKLAYTTSQFTTTWAAEQLCLPLQLVEELFWQLKREQFVEVLGQEGPFNYRYCATHSGRERARHLLEISGYVGPAPVSLASYSAMIQRQKGHWPAVELASVRAALEPLVLPESAVTVAALAAASGRSLFLFGPAGNGKTSLAHALHAALAGNLWIPHCIAIGSTIIRIFDPQFHQPIPTSSERSSGKNGPSHDRRWVCVRRPFIESAGEMTLAELDLTYSPSLRFYESPPHLKANGGIFLIDDFGRQRMQPHELLSRWIAPLERQLDYLSLHTGQKIEVPFQLMLVVSTNLQTSDVADPAFLRRMGYRLHLGPPDETGYCKIFRRCAAQCGVGVSEDVLDQLLARYRCESREYRGSDPRDLIERARELCDLQHRPFELTNDVLDVAWQSYFGN